MVIALVVLSTPRIRDMDWAVVRRVTYLGSHVFSTISPCSHFLTICTERKRHIASTIVEAAINLCRHIYSSSLSINIHYQTTEGDEILQGLLSAGLTKKGIPLMVGGEWKIDDWYLWCQVQREWKKKAYESRLLKQSPSTASMWTEGLAGSPICNADDASGGSKRAFGEATSGSMSSTSAVASTAASAATATLPGAFTCTVVQSRNTAPGSLFDFLNDNNYGKRDHNDKEHQEHYEKLEKERKEKARRENVLRARREQQCKWMELESLKDETTQLNQEKERLVAEHARLSHLMVEVDNVLAEIFHI
ncbi:hypothetical protein ACA910_002184 [Epithemia clementina (nom. ined.)]